MKVEFYGVTSPAIEELTKKKLNKLEKYYKGAEPSFKVTFAIENKQHVVKLETNYNSFSLQAKANSDDMYKSLDLAIENVKRQITKNKFDKKVKRNNNTFDFEM